MSLPELRCLLCDRVLVDENAAVPSERCQQCGKLQQLGVPEHPRVPPGEQPGMNPGEGSLLTTPFDELPEAMPVPTIQPRSAPPVLRPVAPAASPIVEIPVVPTVGSAKPKWIPPVQRHPPIVPRDEEIERPKPRYGCALLVMLTVALMALLAVTFVIYALARGLRKAPRAETTSTNLVVDAQASKPEKPNILTPDVAGAPVPTLWIPPRGNFPLGTVATGTTATLPLPGACTYGVPAGNGRFLLFPIPTARLVAVFDVATAQIVGYLPMPDPQSLIAGSGNHAFVLAPGSRSLARFDLSTLRLERRELFGNRFGQPLAVVAGPAARGPLYLLASQEGSPRLHLLNPDSLQPIDWAPEVAPFQQPNGLFTGTWKADRVYLRTSASGRVLLGGAAVGSQNYRVDKLELLGLSPAITATGISIPGPAFPTADGGMAAFDTNPKASRFPMAEGNGYFEITPKAGSTVLTMTFPGESRVQRAEVKGIEDFADVEGPNRDRRAFLIPSAQALVYLRADGKSIQWRRVRVGEELAKLRQEDYLVVSSTPPSTAIRGQTFNHVPKVLSNLGDAVLKLETAPPGMKVEGASLVWEVPEGFSLGDVPVELLIESKLKPAVSTKLRFTLTVVANAPKWTGLFAPKPPEVRAGRTAKAGDPASPLGFVGSPAPAAKRGQTYRAAVLIHTPEEATLLIAAGPAGLRWVGEDLVWDVPADFPLEPVPVVLTARTLSGRAVSLGYLLEVQE